MVAWYTSSVEWWAEIAVDIKDVRSQRIYRKTWKWTIPRFPPKYKHYLRFLMTGAVILVRKMSSFRHAEKIFVF